MEVQSDAVLQGPQEVLVELLRRVNGVLLKYRVRGVGARLQSFCKRAPVAIGREVHAHALRF